jgi:hypothetical protein
MAKYKYVPPNFTLSSDGCIKLTNFSALCKSYIGQAIFNIEDDGSREPTPKNISRELKAFIDDSGEIDDFRRYLAGSSASSKMYNMCIRAAIAKAKSGNLKGDVDTRIKFSVTKDGCLKISNLNSVVSSNVAMAVFNLRDSGLDVTAKTVIKELKEFINEDLEFSMNLYKSDAVRTMHNKIVRAVIAEI